MRRLLVLFVAVLLVAAACGGGSTGDGSDDGGNDDVPSTEAPDDGGSNDDAPPATEGGDDNDGSEGEGPSTATVTLNGETYEFSSEGAVVAQCLPDLFGIMSVQLPMADGGDGSISITALHDGTDPAEVGEINAVEVSIGDMNWKADPEDVNIAGNAEVEGKSQVDSVEVDGSTVRGTASFAGSVTVFSGDFLEFASGTFEATCGEERLS